ncbi:MAG: hypothetical protein IRZ16_19425 [Myxococcaceae bacterium]|nr:hypothetical protein [Myxococcaceae bacterium]
MVEELVLIRHGPSAHVHSGRMDVEGFRRWRAAYEAAGLSVSASPPPRLKVLAARAGALVTSNAPRAIESMQLLAPERTPIVSPLIRELEVYPPNLGGVRLPLAGWALAFVGQWFYRKVTFAPRAPEAELARAREAAAFLGELARAQSPVVAVTHVGFRALVMKPLEADGWRRAATDGRTRHWSAWTFLRGG